MPRPSRPALCLLLLACLLAASAALAQGPGFTPAKGVTVEGGAHPLPSLEGFEFLGEHWADYGDSVPGKESFLKKYRKGDVILFVDYVNGKPAAYWLFDTKKNAITELRGDFEGDGNFEQSAAGGGEITLSAAAYGLAPRAGGGDHLLKIDAKRLTQAPKFTPAKNVRVEPGYHALPDLSGWELVGEKRAEAEKSLAGVPSLIKEYKKGDQRLFISYLGERPAAYWYSDTKTGKVYGMRADYDGDGNFEQAMRKPAAKPAPAKISREAYTYRSGPQTYGFRGERSPDELTLISF